MKKIATILMYIGLAAPLSAAEPLAMEVLDDTARSGQARVTVLFELPANIATVTDSEQRAERRRQWLLPRRPLPTAAA